MIRTLYDVTKIKSISQSDIHRFSYENRGHIGYTIKNISSKEEKGKESFNNYADDYVFNILRAIVTNTYLSFCKSYGIISEFAVTRSLAFLGGDFVAGKYQRILSE